MDQVGTGENIMNVRPFSAIGQAFRKWKTRPTQLALFPNLKNAVVGLLHPPSKILRPHSCICKSKEGTVYLSKELRVMLEKFREPNKSITTAIHKVLDIVRRNKILIVVVQGEKIHCNMMKKIHQRNHVFCKMLQTMVSLDYCKEKCLAAPIVKEVLEKSKSDNEAEIVSLEKFLPPKIEHLRNPPKIQQDQPRVLSDYRCFSKIFEFCSKTVGVAMYQCYPSFLVRELK